MDHREPNVICFGETLWDCLPHGLFVGGAPYNVAHHLVRFKVPTALATTLGRDLLGELARERIHASSVQLELVREHPTWPTGYVLVRLSEKGDASYDFPQPVAWDQISLDRSGVDAFQSASAVVYGTLSQRQPQNQETLRQILPKTQGLRVFDLNLRPTFQNRPFALDIMALSDVLKVNEDEVAWLTSEAFDFEQPKTSMAAIRKLAPTLQILITLGSRGAFYSPDADTLHYAPAPQIEVRDTIGAGDAFTASFVAGMLGELRHDPAALLKRSTHLGSQVATMNGAQPFYDPADLSL